MKLFAAIKLPPRLTRDITRVQRGVSGARWTDPEKLHITTAFFGEVDDDHAELLDYELARYPLPSFELELEGAGHFGHLEPHAIWLGVKESQALIALHQHCKSAARRAGIVMEKRNYKPHVTLAYMNRSAYLRDEDPSFQSPRRHSPIDRIIAFEKRLARFNCNPFLVDEFFMFSSHRKAKGSNIYRIEASYPMLG